MLSLSLSLQLYVYSRVYLYLYYSSTCISCVCCTCMRLRCTTCLIVVSTVGFRWSWAWNDERGEWEFEKMTKITQYRHDINISIKKRVIVSFYNVSCSLSDTWLAKKRKNIFFTRPTILFLIFDLTFLWFFDFFVQLWFPCGTCGGKPLPVFQFPSK